MFDPLNPPEPPDPTGSSWWNLSRLLPVPANQARLKQFADDFQVREELGFALTGAGEHLCVEVEKNGLTTTEAARRLGAAAGLGQADVGYAGMKDRNARASQWFSLRLAESADGRLSRAEDGSLRILQARRNARKIRIGSHRHNHFLIRLRDFRGCREDAENRLRALASEGAPNYFGPQRFGALASNLEQLRQRIRRQAGGAPGRRLSRGERSRLYSAARALLFNELLSARLERGNWNRFVPGDVAALDGSGRLIPTVEANAAGGLQERLDALDAHLTGPLPGAKLSQPRYETRAKAADMENAVLENHADTLAWLVREGVEAGRRPLRFAPRELRWSWNDNDLLLRFALTRGAYATSLIRELCFTNGSETGNKTES